MLIFKNHVCNTNVLLNLIKASVRSTLLTKIPGSVGALGELEEVLRPAFEGVLGAHGDGVPRTRDP